jgi:hypothetical protein
MYIGIYIQTDLEKVSLDGGSCSHEEAESRRGKAGDEEDRSRPEPR